MHTRNPFIGIRDAPCWEGWGHLNHLNYSLGIMSWYAACGKACGAAGLEVPDDDLFTGVQLCILYFVNFYQT